MSLKKIDGNIRRITTNGNKLNVLIHETALLIMAHAEEHGDCSRAKTLAFAMPASMRRTMLVEWFHTYSPIRIVLKNDKVGLLKDTAKGYVPFDLKAADATPFYEMAEQNPEEKEYDFAALMKMVERLSKTIEKKIEDGKVPADDIESAKAIARAVSGLKVERVAPPANEDAIEAQAA